MRESERRTQTVIPLRPSPLTPGPSPTTASLADARGAAGERGGNVFHRSEPAIDSAGAGRSQFAICIVQFAICNLAAKVWRLQLRGGGPKSGTGICVVPLGLAGGCGGRHPRLAPGATTCRPCRGCCARASHANHRIRRSQQISDRARSHLATRHSPLATRHSPLATRHSQPTTNNQQPTTNNQQPTTNNQQPTTNNQQPTTNNQQPTTKQRCAHKKTLLGWRRPKRVFCIDFFGSVPPKWNISVE